MMAVIEPFWVSKLTSLTASTPPNERLSALATSTGSPAATSTTPGQGQPRSTRDLLAGRRQDAEEASRHVEKDQHQHQPLDQGLIEGERLDEGRQQRQQAGTQERS